MREITSEMMDFKRGEKIEGGIFSKMDFRRKYKKNNI